MLKEQIKGVLIRVWHEQDGVLTFEWTLLLTLLTIGIVSGLTGARDAIIDELGDVAEAFVCLDQSFQIDAFTSDCNVNAAGFAYQDYKPGDPNDPSMTVFDRCGRENLQGQLRQNDCDFSPVSN